MIYYRTKVRNTSQKFIAKIFIAEFHLICQNCKLTIILFQGGIYHIWFTRKFPVLNSIPVDKNMSEVTK